jgi:DNA-binding CsgD family transcriptional regulator
LAGPSFVVELDRRIDAEEPFVPVLQKLTTAERAVAVVVADGLSNQEISERLGKSVEAVKFLLHRIFQKTGVSSRAALVAALRSRPHMRSVTD